MFYQHTIGQCIYECVSLDYDFVLSCIPDTFFIVVLLIEINCLFFIYQEL